MKFPPSFSWHETSQEDGKKYDPELVFQAGLKHHGISNTAFPIAHRSTMQPYKVPNDDIESVAVQVWDGVSEMSLYVHIPFCEQRCRFCEYTVVKNDRSYPQETMYFDALGREFVMYGNLIVPKDKKIVGFDIGGGTPSFVDVRHIKQVIDSAVGCFGLSSDIDISIETTPKIAALDFKKMQELHDMGIRRISMGIQTVNPALLADVGRIATSAQWNIEAAEHIYRAGFERFNVDLMYGFARQSLESVEATIRHAIALDPHYITLYRMRYKGTLLKSDAENVSLEDVNRQVTLMKTILKEGGVYRQIWKKHF